MTKRQRNLRAAAQVGAITAAVLLAGAQLVLWLDALARAVMR